MCFSSCPPAPREPSRTMAASTLAIAAAPALRQQQQQLQVLLNCQRVLVHLFRYL